MKIAFVAMSGLRVVNPVLAEIGLTLPGFVDRGEAIASLPSLSLLTLAALTPERHEVEYHEVADIDELGELPDCDLAAISTYSAQVKEAYTLCGRFREVGTKTVIGGLHVTSLPEEAIEYADAVVVGEGETAWPHVLADAEAGRLGGIYRPRGEDYDLAGSPIPRFELLDPPRYNRLTVQTQRGCPWRCEFCASSILLTPRYKVKPIANIVAEIERIKEIWPERPFIELADDNTFVHQRRGHRLARALRDLDIEWFTETDISVADDAELLRLLSASGCRELLIGLESPSRQGLDGVELRRNWKRDRVEGYRRAVDTIQSHGIAVNVCFVLGLDGDGPEVFDAIAEFVEDVHPFDVQITALTPFPGTPLYRRLLAEGRIIEPGAWETCTLFDVNFIPKHMSPQELERRGLGLAMHLYSEESTALRRKGFKAIAAAGPAAVTERGA